MRRLSMSQAVRYQLGDPESGGVQGGQHRPRLDPSDAGQEPPHLVAAEDDREPLRGLGAHEFAGGPVPPEGDAIGEVQRAAGHVVRAPGLVAADDMQEVFADVGRIELVRGSAGVPGVGGDRPDVGVLGVRGEVPHPHVVEQALTKWSHRVAPTR